MCIETRRQKFVKSQHPNLDPFYVQKSWQPLRAKQFYCMQNNQLGNTVPKQQSAQTLQNRINLLFAALEPCCLAGRFAYNKPRFGDNLFWPKGPSRFFAHKKDLGQGARIFKKISLSSFCT
jgi:hypothetical protein